MMDLEALPVRKRLKRAMASETRQRHEMQMRAERAEQAARDCDVERQRWKARAERAEAKLRSLGIEP